jgi:CheY-like chemotaxis protein/PAS domain-containing protein
VITQSTLEPTQKKTETDQLLIRRSPQVGPTPPQHRALIWRLIALELAIALLTYATTTAIRRDFAALRSEAERDLASAAHVLANRLDDQARRLAGLTETLSVSLQPLLQAGDEAGLKTRLGAAEREFPGLSITRKTAPIGDVEAAPRMHGTTERSAGNGPVLAFTLRLPTNPGLSDQPTLLQIGMRRGALQRLLDETTLSEGRIATVSDPSGRIVARSRDIDSLAGTTIAPALRTALAGAGSGIAHLQGTDGATRTIAFAAAALSGFAAQVTSETDTIAILEFRAMTRALLASLIIAALGTALLVQWARKPTQPATAGTESEPIPNTVADLTAFARELQAGRRSKQPADLPTLREQADRLLHLLDALPVFVLLSHADGTAYFLNRRARLHFRGMPFESAEARADAIHPDDVPKLAGWRQILRSGAGTATVELRCRVEGAYRWHLLQAELLPAPSGQPPDKVTIALDIDTLVQAREAAALARRVQELRLADEQRALETVTRQLAEERAQRLQAQAELMRGLALQGLGRLCASASHLLRDTLATVAGGYDIIRRRSTDPAILQAVADGQQAASRTARLIDHLRTGTLPPSDPDRIADIAEIVTLFALLAPAMPREMKRPELSLPEHLWLARVDGMILIAALLQLATEVPAEPLRIDAFNIPADLAPDFTERVGLTLRTATPSQPVTGQGDGTGMAMLGFLAAQSGGSLQLDGQGRIITLILPRAPLSSASIALAPGTDPSGRPVVLLVDDNDAMRHSAGLLLRTMGLAVQSAANITDALALAQTSAPDLVITDVAMPGGNGPELVASLREALPDIRVIYMTGHDGTELARLGNRVLRKPFSLHELTEMVSDAVAKQEVLF